MGRLSAVRDGAVAVCAAGDYSRRRGMTTRPCPHDLVWFEASALPDDVPRWARGVIATGEPAVVRRAARNEQTLPVGIRGDHRGERHGTRIADHAVTTRRRPETLATDEAVQRAAARSFDVGAWTVLAGLVADKPMKDLCWGVTGALGYELATGVIATRPGSDLDLLVCMPARDDARLAALAAQLADRSAASGVRIDVQVETPMGGIALLDWIGPAARVLVKTDAGPRLVADPWGMDSSISDHEAGPVGDATASASSRIVS